MNGSALARSGWLTASCARLCAAGLGALMAAFLAWVGVMTALHAASRPIALDFIAFWAAAHLAALGHAGSAYDNAVIEPVERAAADMAPGYLAFYYPPTFLLLVLPLGVLPYSLGLAVFLIAGLVLALSGLRKILPQDWAWLPLLTFPGFLMNGLSGQNATLSAACFAGAAALLDSHPALAGACLGGLACKPQLAVLVPVALLAARRWRALAACGATALVLGLLSWAVLGLGAWRGFMANAPLARLDIETIAIKWPKMQSLFGAVRLAGGDNGAAYGAQAVLSAAAACLLGWVCARRPGGLLEMAALATAALLFTPFLYDYDLALLAVPLACLLATAQPASWLPGERLLGATLFVLPLLARPAGLGLGVTFGPPLLALLMVALVRRARLA